MSSILNKEELTEDDIMQLIYSKVEESNSLDFKRSESLSLTDGKKNEISKDVAAFANSSGGYIVYGIEEKDHVASGLSFVDGNIITKEWLEQIIQSRITRKIENVKIIPIRFEGDISKTVYVMKIPDSPSKPHQSSDKKYYRRYEFCAVPMEEYEVQNMYNLKNKCILKVSNVLTHKKYIYKDPIYYFNFEFLVKNIGTSISERFKIVMNVKYDDIHVKCQTHLNSPNVCSPEDGIVQVSFTNENPIFPDEVVSLGSFDLGFHKDLVLHMYKNETMYLKLYYEGGLEEKSYPLKDLITLYTRE